MASRQVGFTLPARATHGMLQQCKRSLSGAPSADVSLLNAATTLVGLILISSVGCAPRRRVSRAALRRGVLCVCVCVQAVMTDHDSVCCLHAALRCAVVCCAVCAGGDDGPRREGLQEGMSMLCSLNAGMECVGGGGGEAA